MNQTATAILTLVITLFAGSGVVWAGDPVSPKQLIVPGVGVGDFKLGMSKDEVLRKLGKPLLIYDADGTYTLENLPTTWYRLFYGHLSLEIHDTVVTEITALNSSYRLDHGLGIGDSENEIKQAFGYECQRKEFGWRDFLSYNDQGVRFTVRKKDRTVEEIQVFPPTDDRVETDAPDSGNVVRSRNPLPGPLVFPKIDHRPKADDDGRPEEMKRLPKYDPDSRSPWQMDLRGRDVSKLDLRHSIDDLLYTTFDDRTVWPANDKMPSGFDPQRIMELGKNPGLGVRSLHKRGITGRGVRIAILDQPLLVDHQEYADRVQLYKEIHIQHDAGPQMHGPAVASIAVGKTVGVAPEAELFYIAQWNFDWEKGNALTFKYLAQGIRRILEINEQLPHDNKIRVISIARGWSEGETGFEDVNKAAQEAKSAGMLVICSSVEELHGFRFHGLGRYPFDNPDLSESYEPGLWWAKGYYEGGRWRGSDRLLIPMDSRTTASPWGNDDYVFYRQGGWSWSIPYIAGVYALAVQVDPAITPERFWTLASKTGRIIELEREGKRYRLGPIIDPVALIRPIEATKD